MAFVGLLGVSVSIAAAQGSKPKDDDLALVKRAVAQNAAPTARPQAEAPPAPRAASRSAEPQWFKVRVVDKATGTVRAVTVGDKALMTAAAPDGTAEVAVAADRRQQPALTPEQAVELARLGVAVEAAFGGPQDVEWAIGGGSTYLLQTRPVTAIAVATARGSLATAR